MVERNRMHGALAAASRLRLLDALRASDRALDARALAAICGLHLNTVRFHLQILSEAGLVRSEPDSSGSHGRPRLRHTPTSVGSTAPGGSGEPAGYQLLAAVLAAHWADTPGERAQRAERAGRATAQRQGFAGRSSTRVTTEDAVAQIGALFAELGFEPELAREGDDLQLRLHACPFRAVALEHPEVVCSMHLGLLRGALDEKGAPATTSSLTPFVQPHLCVARITPTAGPSPTTLPEPVEVRS
jgi:predicted ArsR family transcriptional regulator